MFTSRTGSWDSVRQTFADQFELDGTNFIYRRSQKGEAFRISAVEHERFIDEFERNLRRAKWAIYTGLTVALGAIVLLSVLNKSDLSQGAIFAAIGIAMIPYLAFYRWAWGAPARELAGRVPIAGERSPDDVRRLRFQRMTYGQLASAAFGGLVIPFIGSAHADVFSGWNRLWLVFGGSIVLLAAVQAFRKWRFDQEESYGPSTFAARPPIAEAPDGPGQRTERLPWRYLLIAATLVALAFVFFTPAGKAWVRSPSFLPIVAIAFGGWALFTVARGFAQGRIEPFVRGFSNTYQRETEPKRFWASMAWNAFLGGFFLWIAYQTQSEAAAQAVQDRCYNEAHKYALQEALSACNQMIDGKVSRGGWTLADILLDRGIAYHRLGDYPRAVADYSQAIHLNPRAYWPYYDRALAYEGLGDSRRAIADFTAAIPLRPNDANAYLERGLVFLDNGRFDEAAADFTRAHELKPSDPWALANRGLSYAWMKDQVRAEADFAAVRTIDPSNIVLLHGEALQASNAGDLKTAVARLSEALNRQPDDLWSLRRRAYAYWQLGDYERSRADTEKFNQLKKGQGQR